MDALEQLVRGIHASRWRFVLAATGGGATAIGELTRVPGASRSVLEAIVPYSQAALDRFLGAPPEHYCDARAARAMAMAAFQRAVQLDTQRNSAGPPLDQLSHVAGLGCTASLASEPPKRGPHRFHLGIQTSRLTRTVSLELHKGARSRAEEETVVARTLLGEMARLAEVTATWDEASFAARRRDEVPSIRESRANPAVERLVCGLSSALEFRQGQVVREIRVADAAVPDCVLLPGAFNPFHEGHREMARLASARLGRSVDFELSVSNVDKPPLDFTEIEERLRGFDAEATVWLTGAPTFLSKSRVFSHPTFVVGADTITRIGEAKYYAQQAVLRDAALEELRRNGARFLVFGRYLGGRFETLDSLRLPAPLAAMCTGVAESDFRQDISSTALRRARE